MLKKKHYVHHINPITGITCTTRLVVTDKDVTLWQVDREIDSEPMFDCIDSSEIGMVSMPHTAFRETMRKYLDSVPNCRFRSAENCVVCPWRDECPEAIKEGE